MKPELQRIKIAEACGWQIKPDGKYEWVVTSPENFQVAWSSTGGVANDKSASTYLPDYLADLNAMHEAFTMIRGKDHAIYWQLHKKLDGIVAIANSCEGGSIYESIATADATATQRAEAFLKTLGKWEESE